MAAEKLKLMPPSEEEAAAAHPAEDREEQKEGRCAPCTCSLCQIFVGAGIAYCHRADETSGLAVTVAAECIVDCQGRKGSLSALASMRTQSRWRVAGPGFFKYNGKWFNDIRKRLGV